MKLPITSDPKRSELEKLTPEHVAYLQNLEEQITSYNMGNREKPEIPGGR